MTDPPHAPVIAKKPQRRPYKKPPRKRVNRAHPAHLAKVKIQGVHRNPHAAADDDKN